MLNMKVMALGAYQTNCYIIWGEGSDQCIVIDPGFEADAVLRQVKSLGKTVEAILLTHGHFDHVGAVKEIAAETGCRVYLCPDDLSMPAMFTAGPLYYTDSYGKGDRLQLAGLSLRILQTPGHTQGSVCIACEDCLFSGDTLFEGSCGRTDLPGGNYAQILQSLKRLRTLDDCRVFPGHGPATTLAEEKKYNPYMR